MNWVDQLLKWLSHYLPFLRKQPLTPAKFAAAFPHADPELQAELLKYVRQLDEPEREEFWQNTTVQWVLSNACTVRGNADVMTAAAKLLAGQRSLPNALRLAVLRLLEHEGKEVVRGTGVALSKDLAETFIPELTALLDHPRGYSRGAAIIGLEKTNACNSFKPRFKEMALQDSDEWVRWIATLRLADFKLPADEGLEIFLQLARDKYDSVRYRAIEALLKYGELAAPAVPLIIEHMKSETHQKHFRDLGELGSAGKDLIPILRTEADKSPAYAVETIFKLGGDVMDLMPLLIKEIKEGSEGACDTITVLGPLSKDAVPALIDALKDESWDLQWAAADALGAIGPAAAAAAPQLVERVRNGGGLVPGSACSALFHIGKPAVPSIIQGLEAQKTDARRNSTWFLDALARIGPDASEAIPLIQEFAKQGTDVERAWAALALQSVAKGESVDIAALTRGLTLDDNSYFQSQCALGLARIGSNATNAVPTLLRVFSNNDTTLKGKETLRAPSIGDTLTQNRRDMAHVDVWLSSAIALLSIQRTTNWIPIVEKALDHPNYPDIQIEAVRVLADVGSTASVSEIKPLLKSDNAGVRDAAKAAIETLK